MELSSEVTALLHAKQPAAQRDFQPKLSSQTHWLTMERPRLFKENQQEKEHQADLAV